MVLPRRLFFSVLASILILSGNAVVQAMEAVPTHQLAISFEPAGKTLRGDSRIDIQPDMAISVQLGDLDVSSIKLAGRTIPATGLDGTMLSIPPAPTNRELVIHYRKTMSASEAPRGNLISPEGITLTGLWHPLLDRDALFELTAVLPDGFTAVSEAETVTTRTTPSGKEVRFHFPYPLSGINFAAGPYLVKKIPFGRNRELYAYFFHEDEKLLEGYLDKTLLYLKRYEKLIGPYPYRRFSIVENRLPTGFAMPTFTLLGQAVVRLPFITDTSLGHEVLHSWFGNSIRIVKGSGNWAEGLTTYLADQSFARDRGQDADFRKGQLIGYQSYVLPDNTMPARQFSGASSHLGIADKSQRAIGYAKVSQIFHMLRKRLGDEAFFKGLRDFYHRMRYKPASWNDLEESFEQAAGTELSRFFDQWLDRADIPRLAAQNIMIDQASGAPQLTFQLVQDQQKPYELAVPVRVKTPDETITRVIQLTGRQTEVTVPLADLPTELAIDPEYDLMRALTPAELPPVWSRFLGSTKKLAVLPAGDQTIFAPLVAVLKEYGCRTLTADQATDKEIADTDVIFLGTDTPVVRSLFADPGHPRDGLTLEVRENPLGPGRVAVLVSAADEGEVAQATRKLLHYGKYSFLRFQQGHIRRKRLTETPMGQIHPLDTPPRGIAPQQAMTFEKIMAALHDKRVIYIGETHTRNEDHRLQLRVIRALYKQNPKLAVGMEMFPRRVQKILDAYVDGTIGEWEFLKKSHYFKNWGFDYRLYRDIINFARRHKLPIIALNLEKKLVGKVFRKGGITALTPDERKRIPNQRKLDMPGYRQRLAQVFRMHDSSVTNGEQLNNFLESQALWDETMAESVVHFLSANPGFRMAVVAGHGHTAKDTGIPPRVARRLEVSQTVLQNAQEYPLNPETTDYVLFSPEEPLPPAALLGVQLLNSERGVMVAGLSPHGKAGKSGIIKKDIILALDDEPVATIEDLKIAMVYKKKGDTARVRIRRPHAILPDEIKTVKVPL